MVVDTVQNSSCCLRAHILNRCLLSLFFFGLTCIEAVPLAVEKQTQPLLIRPQLHLQVLILVVRDENLQHFVVVELNALATRRAVAAIKAVAMLSPTIGVAPAVWFGAGGLL